MVRVSLQKFYHKKQNVPRVYTGKLGEVSISRHSYGYPVLLSDVCLATGEQIADHVWIRFEMFPQTMGFNIGDVIQFTGVVGTYKKQGGSMDYGIEPVRGSFTRGVEA
jgi:hypothetical protein